ncbi:MAG TPA: hypothetical protein VFK69_07700 [Candidatus Eisenbacteria bacterium]|nr:hypothetical protein [Candidatus Eisenbacteria bacterium]
MNKWPLRFLLGVSLLFAASLGVARADTLLFGYQGFDYESPDPNPSTFGEVGSGYVGVGFAPFLFAPLVADTMNNEYTYVITGLTPVNSQMFGSYLVVDYGTGSLSLYEDSKSGGTAADYGQNPPNALAPSTFSDGTLFLQATLTNFQIVINTSNGSGSYEGALTFTGGSQINNFPLNQRSGWQFAGTSSNALNIPPGYYHQVVGQGFLSAPVAAQRISWGALKAVYRAEAPKMSGGAR